MFSYVLCCRAIWLVALGAAIFMHFGVLAWMTTGAGFILIGLTLNVMVTGLAGQGFSGSPMSGPKFTCGISRFNLDKQQKAACHHCYSG